MVLYFKDHFVSILLIQHKKGTRERKFALRIFCQPLLDTLMQILGEKNEFLPLVLQMKEKYQYRLIYSR